MGIFKNKNKDKKTKEECSTCTTSTGVVFLCVVAALAINYFF